MKSKHTDEWVSLMEGALKTKEKLPRGEGWITRGELAQRLSLTECQAKARLTMLKKTGSVEYFQGIQMVDGKLQGQNWYRIKKGSK